MITSRLLDHRERCYLAWAAVSREIAHLPLESAPIDASPHALELHFDGLSDPLVVIAEPMGAPDADGFPLRLRPLSERHEARLRAELFGTEPPVSSAPATEPSPPPRISVITPAAGFVPRRPSTIPPPLSDSHAHALARTSAATLSRRVPGALTGRLLGDGRFALETLLGSGSSGEVYRGMHTALHRSVAIKVLHPRLQRNQDYCTRFYGEALSASRLDHRNVLRVHDYGQEPDGLLYIVMELLEGKSIQQILDETGPLPLERIVRLVSQACAGLAHAHDADVIHRDIKPENMLVMAHRDDDGHATELVKVCDFGIAHWKLIAPKRLDEDEPTLMVPPDRSMVVGTPVYMAPEQIQNEPVDARTDVYAVGVVLYELATGHLPFTAANPLEILRQHLLEPPTPPSKLLPSLDPDLEAVILAAMQKDPAKRYADARALRAALRALVDGGGPSVSGTHRRFSLTTSVAGRDLLADPNAALRLLQGPNVRSGAYDRIADAIRTALLAGEVKVAHRLVAWLDARLSDPGLAYAEREAAERALHAVRAPEVARGHAMNLLDAKVGHTHEALSMLRAAGPVAARALIDARLVRPATSELRAQLVEVLRCVGASALPVIVATLEPLARVATPQEEALAEDLLRAMPEVRSDTAGEAAVRFVRFDRPALGLAALKATASLWGPRACPLLVGALDANVDAFRSLAIEHLRRLDAIDEAVVERLGRIVGGQSPSRPDLRLLAATALGFATPEARPRALALLTQRLAPARGFMSSLIDALGGRDDAPLVVALARSLAALDREGAVGVLERIAASRPELRARMEAVLRGD